MDNYPLKVVIVLVGVLIALVLAFYLLATIGWGIYEGFRFLYRVVTGETRREKQLSNAKWRFEEATSDKRFPSEDELTMLFECDDCFSYRYNRPPADRFPGLASSKRWSDAVKSIRYQQQAEAELKSSETAYKELADKFAGVACRCDTAWVEMIRIAEALSGTFNSGSFAQVLKCDLFQILKAMSVANGGVLDGLGRLFQAVVARLEPQTRITTGDCCALIQRWDHTSVNPPPVLKSLAGFDKLQQTHYASIVSEVYAAAVVAAFKCLPQSSAVVIVKDTYLSLLEPYMSDNTSSRNRSDGDFNTSINGNCAKCVEYYSVLRLKPDASENEIRMAYRDLALINHPDRFQGNDRVRRRAEEQMKAVNEAYSHIVAHSGFSR
jgi:hypothetical protein